MSNVTFTTRRAFAAAMAELGIHTVADFMLVFPGKMLREVKP